MIDTFLNRSKSVFVGGSWIASDAGPVLSVTNPSNGSVFATLNSATIDMVDQAVSVADAAFVHWKLTTGAARAVYLDRFASGLRQRQEALVSLQMLNNGKPRVEAEIDVSDAVATFEYYAQLARELDDRQGQPVASPDPAFHGKTRFEPIGPVGMIVPWNFPLVTSAWKIAPALAAGCTLVMKNSEVTPLAELVYGDIAQEAELPAGVLNIVPGGAEVGMALTANAGLRKVSFTGSNMIGAKVMQAVSARCLPISLELGGKSPIVVLEDADIDLAVECIAAGIFFNCGQMCSATSRLIISKKIAPAVLDKLVTHCKGIKYGDPTLGTVDMGPITLKAQQDKVAQYLKLAEKDRLKTLCGGEIGPSGGGYYVQPTIYLDVPTTHPIWREEVFGPVLAVQTFTTEAEALKLANDSEYGLVATVISADPDRAETLAARIEAGHIWINSPQIIFPNTAWGGFKASGIGRELGPWGLGAYQGVKHLTIANL